jgi:hypothetical protein
MQILHLGKKYGEEDTMMENLTTLLSGGNETGIWNETQYVNEEQKIWDLFLHDPEFMEYIARMRALKARC